MKLHQDRPNLIEILDGRGAGILGDRLVGLAGLGGILNVVGDGASEDDDIEKRVGSETVRAMYGDTGGLSSGVQTWHYLIIAVLECILQQDCLI